MRSSVDCVKPHFFVPATSPDLVPHFAGSGRGPDRHINASDAGVRASPSMDSSSDSTQGLEHPYSTGRLSDMQLVVVVMSPRCAPRTQGHHRHT